MDQQETEVNTPGPETRISGGEADKALGQIIDRAADGERIVITRHGRDRVVMLAKREYDDLLRRAGETPAAPATEAA